MYDVHTHFIPNDVIEWMKKNKKQIKATWEKKDPNREEFLTVGDKWSFEFKKDFFDSSLYLNEQKKAGVEHSLVSPIPQLFMYDFPSDITHEMAKLYNQSMAKWVKDHSDQLSGLATLPLNNPELAANELRDAMKMGLKGAIIGPGFAKYMLSDEFFAPLWNEANHLKAIIFIHPLLNEDPRLKRRMMPNLIGVPWETTICATDLLLSGLLDHYPQVKILLSHGGGFLPYQIGRLNKGYEQWNLVSKSLEAKPQEYLQRFWYDSILWNEENLRALIDLVGEERVVPGSDYPFDLCSWPPVLKSQSGVQTLLNLS